MRGIKMSDLRNLLKIADSRLAEINALLTDPGNELITELLEVIDEYGGPQEINRKAQEAGKLENLMAGLKKAKSPIRGTGGRLFRWTPTTGACWVKKPNHQGSISTMP